LDIIAIERLEAWLKQATGMTKASRAYPLPMRVTSPWHARHGFAQRRGHKLRMHADSFRHQHSCPLQPVVL